MSYLKPLSVVCSVCFVLLSVFQLGALYGASPYRALVLANAPKQEFLQLNLSQTHTLFIVAGFAFGFAVLNVVALVLRRMQETKSRTNP